MVLKDSIKVALAGNPNSGKTTLFNLLTGLNQKTGNFPGITIEKKSGFVQLKAQGKDTYKTIEFIDLPGIYSLYPRSLDEQITHRVLTNVSDPDHQDIVLTVVDSANLKRSLFFVIQLIDLKLPMIVVLNETQRSGRLNVDVNKLSEKLGVKIIRANAITGKGATDIKRALLEPVVVSEKTFFVVNSSVESKQMQADESIERYKIIDNLLSESGYDESGNLELVSEKLDKILTHKVWGYVIFLGILLLIFQSVFFLAAYPMSWIESFFIFVSHQISSAIPSEKLNSLVVNGVIAGISGVAVFIPQIALLFGLISIMEETGYMARVSFIMDRTMRKFGLNGRSIIPLVSGVACAVPAIMSTRTISNWKERLITIMVTPLMSCSARLPVYTLLIALVVPAGKFFGVIGYQGLMLLFLYLIGFIAAIGAAWVMKKIIKTKEKSYFVLEMPEYRVPRINAVFIAMFEKVKVFLVDAGKIIIAISIVLWALSSYAPGDSFAEIEKKYNLAYKEGKVSEKEKDILVASQKLEASYAGRVGHFIEPAIAPLGFDWKIGIALVTSFAAREVFVGTMATIYSVGDADETSSIRKKMMNEKDPKTGVKKYTFALGFSLMIFYAFAMQCMSTIAVVFRETKTWKWPIIQFIYMGVLAYAASFIVYNLFS